MWRWTKRIVSGFGIAAFVLIAVGGTLVATGIMPVEKARRLIIYNPLYTQTQPVFEESRIQTGLIRLVRQDYSLPSLGAGLVNGAGAAAEFGDGVLVGERTGRMFFFRAEPEPTLEPLDFAFAVNDDLYAADAERLGYDVKPGTGTGYGGLGMRLLDLLVLRDGKTLVTSYSHWVDDGDCAVMQVAVTTLGMESGKPVAVEGPKPVWQASPCLPLGPNKAKPFSGQESGGRMVEMADGKILLTLGDYKFDGHYRDMSNRDPGMDYGKTQVIDLETGEARIFTIGHRNPQGLAIAADGRIWSAEHGPNGGDEVNLLVEGADYGWPDVTLGVSNGIPLSRHDGYRLPQYAYMPAVAISALIEVQGFAPLWDGDLLHGSLRAETLFHLRTDGDRIVFSEPIKIGQRIRDMQQLSDGRVLLYTDGGRLIYLSEDREKSKSELLAAAMSPDARRMLAECAQCHLFEPGQKEDGKVGLWGVAGRNVAAMDFEYSDALLGKGGAWTRDELDAYIADPAGAVPGTIMAHEGVADAAVRKELVDYLTQLK